MKHLKLHFVIVFAKSVVVQGIVGWIFWLTLVTVPARYLMNPERIFTCHLGIVKIDPLVYPIIAVSAV